MMILKVVTFISFVIFNVFINNSLQQAGDYVNTNITIYRIEENEYIESRVVKIDNCNIYTQDLIQDSSLVWVPPYAPNIGNEYEILAVEVKDVDLVQEVVLEKGTYDIHGTIVKLGYEMNNSLLPCNSPIIATRNISWTHAFHIYEGEIIGSCQGNTFYNNCICKLPHDNLGDECIIDLYS